MYPHLTWPACAYACVPALPTVPACVHATPGGPLGGWTRRLTHRTGRGACGAGTPSTRCSCKQAGQVRRHGPGGWVGMHMCAHTGVPEQQAGSTQVCVWGCARAACGAQMAAPPPLSMIQRACTASGARTLGSMEQLCKSASLQLLHLCSHHACAAVAPVQLSCLCSYCTCAAIMPLQLLHLCSYHAFAAVAPVQPSCLCSCCTCAAIMPVQLLHLCSHHAFAAVAPVQPSCLCSCCTCAAIMSLQLLRLCSYHAFAASASGSAKGKSW